MQLQRYGLIFRNDTAEWLSPVLIVDKPGAAPGVYRLVVDLKYINYCTETLNQALPVLQDELQKTKGMNYFMTVDFLQGFFQMPLHEDSQEFYSMLTPFGIYSFRRAPQGAASCPGWFHNPVALAFESIMSTDNAILWIDDLLFMGRTFREFLTVLRNMFKYANSVG